MPEVDISKGFGDLDEALIKPKKLAAIGKFDPPATKLGGSRGLAKAARGSISGKP